MLDFTGELSTTQISADIQEKKYRRITGITYLVVSYIITSA